MSPVSSDITSALAPDSPQAQAIRALMIGVIIMASVIALIVTGLVAWTLIRFADRGGQVPAQSDGNRTVEIIYTVIPLCMMATLFVCTVITMGRAEPQTHSPLGLQIIAHQWWWELRYPAAHVISANEIHLPAREPIETELSSSDVIHELWIPQLGPKMDAVPGQINRLVLRGDTPGIYLGQCAEFCGAAHALMRVRVIVQPRAEFDAWEASQRELPKPMQGIAAQGRDVFMSHSCVQCHAVDGTTAQGNAGPNLTHFASRATLASCIIDNTPTNLRRWLANPGAIKPGCYMPNMRLTNEQIEQTAAYLESLK
jgi:cytochrome c oxidase subunit 2